MFFKSIRFKFILWYMLLLALTLGVFSAFVYHSFKKSLYDDMDGLLSSRAEGVAEAIDTYWEAEKADAAKEGVSRETFSKIDNINFIKIAQEWVEEKSNDPKLLGIMVEIFDSKGHEIASSKNISKSIVLFEGMRRLASSGNGYFDTVSLLFGEGKPQQFRVFSLPVIENKKVAYVVLVARSLGSLNVAFNDLRLILFILLPITVVLTGLVGIFLAQVTLRPIHHMIDAIHRITAENLESRIRVSPTGDEIQSLAETFNEMLKRLNSAFRFERQFTQDISHELKTPLTILKGELEVALKKMRSPQEYALVLESNLEEINRLIRIIDGLLTLARFDQEEVKLAFTRFSLNELVEELLEDIRVLAKQKNIDVCYVSCEPILLDADVHQIRGALLNILDNAVKYTPEAGQVTLTLSKEEKWAKIDIRDTGIGIPREELPHIFDRFYRVDKSRSSLGFGLGLSIVESIIEAHDGRIEVASVLHQGTSFTISLPLRHTA